MRNDALPPEMEWDWWKRLWSYTKANVTLDPDTAHPILVVSEDGKSVRRVDALQDLPDTLERFDTSHCVLGSEGFTSGRHYWEVEVGNGKYWGVGLARESVRRKGRISPSPEEGIWAMGIQGSKGQFNVYHGFSTPGIRLISSETVQRVGVSLYYEAGEVAFLDADWKSLLFCFPLIPFHGERILPYFWVRGSPLRLCS
ncbi:butyrophilin subfamily 1 member A1-like [Chelonoidis abingdonii]|uniref:butyrophilin subfamily 1 member A1-like n=1 Tax=Chelonoidis abingdonii TaxID=106734 RepID=UPI0013F23539|nr:thaicobrin-like isoform X1 [Chelonoidis abingdonii]